MLERFRWISNLHGRKTLAILVFLLLGLVLLSIAGFLVLESLIPAAVASGGLLLGWLLRRPIVTHTGDYSDHAVFWVLAVYGVVLFLGKRLNWDPLTTLTIITAATVIVFNLRFLVASDPVWAFTHMEVEDAQGNPEEN
jgi:hypothetical protein